ncbi:MAG TPA: hypothetical protein VNE17_03410 [Nitrolancea sp.]|nr:hypothetical protein [Nitrolancea sp.]
MLADLGATVDDISFARLAHNTARTLCMPVGAARAPAQADEGRRTRARFSRGDNGPTVAQRSLVTAPL